MFAPAVLRVLRPEGAFTAPELRETAAEGRRASSELERRAADWLLVFVSSVLAFELAIGVFGGPGRIVAAGLVGTLLLAWARSQSRTSSDADSQPVSPARVAPRSHW